MGNNNEVPGVIVLVTGVAVTIGIICCATVAMSASMMHAALGNDFMKGADIGWISSYVSKMLRTTIWAGFVLMLVGIAVNIAGFLFFCIGLLVASPILNLMAADMVSQLHDIFVTRGGMPAYADRQDDRFEHHRSASYSVGGQRRLFGRQKSIEDFEWNPLETFKAERSQAKAKVDT